MLDILIVAKYFLSLGSMNHKKLQKLCFYAQAWHLAFTGNKLMDTDFEAWIHGPVSPRLYNEYKEWRGLVIPQRTCPEDELHTLENFKKFLHKIYDLYKEYSADELEELTHSEEPWIEARKGYKKKDICRVVINNQTITDFYRGLVNAR